MLLHGHYVRPQPEEKSHYFIGMKTGMGTAAARSLSQKTKRVWLGWKVGTYCAIVPSPSPKPVTCKGSGAFILR